jgi:DNA replication protein DnaC
MYRTVKSILNQGLDQRPDQDRCNVITLARRIPARPASFATALDPERKEALMNPMPELTPMLKQLRLSGIMDSIESRNRQAIEKKDVLHGLSGNDHHRRDRPPQSKEAGVGPRRANFRNQKTLEEFDFTFNPNINRRWLWSFRPADFSKRKSACSSSDPAEQARAIWPRRWDTAPSAMATAYCSRRLQDAAQLNAARAINGFDRHFGKLAGVDLLIIDDFGLKPLKPGQDEDFHDVISERYERKSTIVTSNLTDAFSNRILGEATIDRLRHGAYTIVLEGRAIAPRGQSKSSKNSCQNQPKKGSLKGGEKPSLEPVRDPLFGHLKMAPLRRSWVAPLG